jgi:hypothetical protein
MSKDIAGVDPFLKAKWERVFYTFFDTNQNKVIDWNDFEILFDKIKELRGAESQEFRIVDDAMRAVWKGLLQETKGIDMTQEVDNTVEITVDEWNLLWSKFNPRSMQIWQWEYLKYMFFLIDTSGDKFVDADEYATVMKIYGVSDAKSRKAFAKFAVDSKGKKLELVDYGQFVRLWYDYFGSPDKTKPGSFLFGDWD